MDNKPQNLDNRKNIYLEYALFLILGFLLGVVVKTEAAKRITVGYNDYQVSTKAQVYDLNKIQKDIMDEAKIQSEAQNGGANGVTEGAETSR